MTRKLIRDRFTLAGFATVWPRIRRQVSNPVQDIVRLALGTDVVHHVELRVSAAIEELISETNLI